MIKALTSVTVLFLLIYSNLSFALDSYYCAHGSQFVKPGMSSNQVTSACGPPSSVDKSKKPSTSKVPVTQWLYQKRTTSTGSNVYSLNTGASVTFIVSFKDDKASSINLAGNSVPSVSICDRKISVGDSESKVKSRCGSPDSVNETYENVFQRKVDQVEVWSYQPSKYQPILRLTFVNGVLQSLDQ